jgi:hypothetical protein
MYDPEEEGWTTLDGQIYLMEMEARGGEVLLFDLVLGAWSNLAPTLRSRRQGSLFVLDVYLHAGGGN